MRKIVSIFTVFFLLSVVIQSNLYAQKKNRNLIKAEKSFSVENYMDALKYYKKAYKKAKLNSTKAEISFKQAECYRLSGNIDLAEIYYEIAIMMKYPDAIVFLKYADVLRMKGKIDKATEQYNIYKESNPVDYRGDLGIKSCEFALKWKDLPTRYIVENLRFVNSFYNDFSPSFGNSDYSKLFFVSSREGDLSDKKDGRTGQFFSDIWFTELDKQGNWSFPKLMAEPINTVGNEGPLFVNDRGTVMYLTQCKFEKKKDLGCGIFVSEAKGKSWMPTQLLQLKTDGYTVGHPTLSSDENVIVFSSDLPNGYGGKDLWMSVKSKRNTWSDPVNLGALVNTPGDEMFPFLAEDGTIYFASNGHVGMGGLDIYKTSTDDYGAYILPVNLKSPINSFGDDFGMIIEKGGERGYLTSNRAGGSGGDDIYQFELLALNLVAQGIVTDARTGAILTNAKVEFIGSDGKMSEVYTDNTGKYSQKLRPITSYEIFVSIDGYEKLSIRETTEGVEIDKVFINDVQLNQEKKKLILPIVNFDFNKHDLRKENVQQLDNLAAALIDHSNVVLEVRGHTDDVGSINQNNRLSKKRADICVEYLISKGVNPEQLISKGLGKSEPYIILQKDGKFKVGDVLTENFIKKLRFKKNRKKANQYNRRASFRILNQDLNKNN
tara:strand:+ start:43 stop:2028 length:1986 start_codon:yes stop_codon:yes gene_type:complete